MSYEHMRRRINVVTIRVSVLGSGFLYAYLSRSTCPWVLRLHYWGVGILKHTYLSLFKLK